MVYIYECSQESCLFGSMGFLYRCMGIYTAQGSFFLTPPYLHGNVPRWAVFFGSMGVWFLSAWQFTGKLFIGSMGFFLDAWEYSQLRGAVFWLHGNDLFVSMNVPRKAEAEASYWIIGSYPTRIIITSPKLITVLQEFVQIPQERNTIT